MTDRRTIDDDLRRIARWGDPGQVPELPDRSPPACYAAIETRSSRSRVLVVAALVVAILASSAMLSLRKSSAPVAAAQGTWRHMANSPLSPRVNPAGLWTGSELLVFGGSTVDERPLLDGAAYTSKTDSWRKLAPFPFEGAGLWRDGLPVWTGSEALFFIRVAPLQSGTGTRDWDMVAYDPKGDRWRRVLEARFTEPREDVLVPNSPVPLHLPWAAAWIEGSLVIVGGHPDAGSHVWVKMNIGDKSWGPTVPLPDSGPNFRATLMATDGRRMLSSDDGIFVADRDVPAFLIHPSAGSVARVPLPQKPSRRYLNSTGSRLAAAGGRFVHIGAISRIERPGDLRRTAYVLNPASARWRRATPPPDSPVLPSAALVGTPYGIFLLGGLEGGAGGLEWDGATAVAADLELRRWSKLRRPPIDLHRVGHVAVWTGHEILVWGGSNDSGNMPRAKVLPFRDGARYRIP